MPKRLYYFLIATVTAFIVAVAGCTGSSTAPSATDVEQIGDAAAPTNESCPVMGNPVTKEGGHVEWNGQLVGFCCPKCIDKWNAFSSDEKMASLSDSSSTQTHSPDHSMHQ